MRDKPLHPLQVLLVALALLAFVYLVVRAVVPAGPSRVAESPTVNPSPPTTGAVLASTSPSRPAGPPPPFVEHEGRITRALGAELATQGVPQAGVNELVAAFEGVLDFRKIRQGAKFTTTVRSVDGRLEKFRYETGPLEVYEAARDAAGKLSARKVDVPVRREVAEIGAELKVSLYQAMQRAGESPALVADLVDVFAFDLDFYKDPRPGDRFRVLVEKVFSGDRFIEYGRLLAAEYTSARHGKTFRVFYFGPEGGANAKPAPWAGYYDETGQNTRKTFLKTPLKFARVSSKFDLKRKHPILKYTRAHYGTDYAARTGTPVWAMAGGVVRKAAFERGFGNVVVIDHKNGLLSFSAHLSRFAKGIKAGVAVEQKQVVGYVGMTGLATGPHLHFGVKRNGAWVDSEKLKQSRDPPVPAKLLPTFKQQVQKLAGRLSTVEIRTAPPAEAEDPETEDTDEAAEAPPLSVPNAVVQPPALP
jgi:murein DD-endopeptidase MepM/ murein hydrolase activator NlpD